MRIRWGLLAPVLTGIVLLAAYQDTTTSARAVPDQAVLTKSAAGVAELEPGNFRFTTGLDKVPQHIRGPVTCDTRDDTYRIAIGDPDAGGVEIGLSQDESILKYVDLGYRNGVYLALFNDEQTVGDQGQALPSVRKTGDTYVASGYARGMTPSQHDARVYFEISVACP
jgi:hypothetical protein